MFFLLQVVVVATEVVVAAATEVVAATEPKLVATEAVAVTEPKLVATEAVVTEELLLVNYTLHILLLEVDNLFEGLRMGAQSMPSFHVANHFQASGEHSDGTSEQSRIDVFNEYIIIGGYGGAPAAGGYGGAAAGGYGGAAAGGYGASAGGYGGAAAGKCFYTLLPRI